MYAGTPTHPVTQALQPHLARFNLRRASTCWRSSTAWRWTWTRPATSISRPAALLLPRGRRGRPAGGQHLRRDATAQTLKYADKLGLAFQLTNIIRDVGEDARKGRIYLPIDELQQFDVTAADILNARHSDNFDAADGIPGRARRSRSTTRRSPSCRRSTARAQRPGLIMAAIYRTLLDEIERDGFQVLNQRTSLTPMRKLWLAWKTWVAAEAGVNARRRHRRRLGRPAPPRSNWPRAGRRRHRVRSRRAARRARARGRHATACRSTTASTSCSAPTRETLRLMRQVGVDPDAAAAAPAAADRYPAAQRHGFRAPRLPAPLHLAVAPAARARAWRARQAGAARFMHGIARWMGWRLDDDCTVAELLDALDQTERLRRAAVGAAVHRRAQHAARARPRRRCSCNVLRDSLGAPRARRPTCCCRASTSARCSPSRRRIRARQRRHGAAGHAGATRSRARACAGAWTTRPVARRASCSPCRRTRSARLLAPHCATRRAAAPRSTTSRSPPVYLQYRASDAAARAVYALADRPTAGTGASGCSTAAG